ncbi:hypothetical protein RD728_002318 [Enterococcus faecalis]|nr:hypothetical protein [Enterococcus faecalis]
MDQRIKWWRHLLPIKKSKHNFQKVDLDPKPFYIGSKENKNIFLFGIGRNPKVEQGLGENSPREKATLEGWCEEE